MDIITDMLVQTAVYWPPAGADSYGQPTWDNPSEVDCRWEDIAVQFLSPGGTQELSRARVYVGSDVEVQGVLMLGDLNDVSSGLNPKQHNGAWEIRQFEKLPVLYQDDEPLRTAYL